MSNNKPFVKYAEYYDSINKNKPYKEEIEFVYKWANKPETILDLGCGTASYWKYYPKKAYILGVDRSENMIKESKYGNHILCDDITTFYMAPRFDCVTALFDVVNYISDLKWFKNIPLKRGGYFIFDIWDKDKADADGFRKTVKMDRIITPERKKNIVNLDIMIRLDDETVHELHTMYLHSDADIIKACGKKFKIVDKKETETWQTWFKLERL